MAQTELRASQRELHLVSTRRITITKDSDPVFVRSTFGSGSQEHLVRPRINALLAQAIKNPLTIVCGGMGYGKTRAVYDFTRECDFPVMWLQLPEPGNPVSHFWEVFVRAIAQINKSYAKELKKLGPPDTDDTLNMFSAIRKRMQPDVRRLYVIDDFHLVKDASVLRFLERAIIPLPEDLPLTSVILIGREFPTINISSLVVRNTISLISETELSFTENELHRFLQQEGLDSETNSLSKIYEDTKGWPLIINFVAQILKKIPGYAGYARSTILQDITRLIEMEVWSALSERLKRLFLRLSLTSHRSMDLVNILAEEDESLISEFKKQNVFVRCDRLTDTYRIHSLFFHFLCSKKDALTDDEIRNTYKTVADWCVKNDFIIDALLTYEKTGDYESIVSIVCTSNAQFLQKNSSYIIDIFNRAPAEIFGRVNLSAAIHVHAVMCAGKFQQALAMLRHYEAKYLDLPEDNAFRNRMLGYMYYLWGIMRMVLSSIDDCYDFDTCFAKQYECLKNFPINPKCWYQHPANLWTSFVSNARAGAPQEYINALIRSMSYIDKCSKGLGAGIEDLCRGELALFQTDIHEAEVYLNRAMERAHAYEQYEIVSRALFFIMRIAAFQGDYAKLELALKNAERQLTCNQYSGRFLTYDLVVGWYYSILGQPERMPGWLKEKFTYSLYPNGIENFGNYIKARYHYLTMKYDDLLAFLETKRQPGTGLYERVEALAVEACAHVKMNNTSTALCALQEAYETARPNGLFLPFIELSKDMRMVIGLAEKCPNCAIPRPWLQSIRQGTSKYCRSQAMILSGYSKTYGRPSRIMLSPQEIAILRDLRDGLSRLEIAAKRALSVNTVKVHINSIYNKLGARNRADMFRIATEDNIL